MGQPLGGKPWESQKLVLLPEICMRRARYPRADARYEHFALGVLFYGKALRTQALRKALSRL